MDVSRIYPSEWTADAIQQKDAYLRASYVDRIVDTLSSNVRTGTGMAKKTPIQTDNGEWLGGYSSEAVTSMNAKERSATISTWGRNDPFQVMKPGLHRYSGPSSELDPAIMGQVGKSYKSFNEAHQATYGNSSPNPVKSPSNPVRSSVLNTPLASQNELDQLAQFRGERISYREIDRIESGWRETNNYVGNSDQKVLSFMHHHQPTHAS